jgi:hypothetical protein
LSDADFPQRPGRAGQLPNEISRRRQASSRSNFNISRCETPRARMSQSCAALR